MGDPVMPLALSVASAEPRHLLLHLSDPHFVGDGRRLYGDVDSRSRLLELLQENLASESRPDAVIITGDLADAGEVDAYRELRKALHPFEERGARLIWLVGNHDDRSNFRRAMVWDPEDAGHADNADPLYGVHHIGGLRVIALDTSVPGFHHGELDAGQLDWLGDQLEHPAPEGTILAMHHPPIRLIQPIAHLTELRDMAALAEVIRGSDVRLILAGHLHTSTSGMFAGIPVSVASATSYTQDTNVSAGGSRGRDGAQAVTLVHVYEESIVTTVSPIGRYDTVGEYLDPETVSDRLARGSDRVSRRA